MFKRFMFVSLCLLAYVVTHAQAPAIDRSPAFEEPEDGASRLLLMKNGNTLFFHFTPKEGIDVRVYDAKHLVKAEVNNYVKSWEPRAMMRAKLAGLYEINGQAVVFIQLRVERSPCLYRLCFDSKTGKLLDEHRVASLINGYDDENIQEFYVRKDPNSEYYAVAVFNSFAHSSDERIQIIHYNPNHKEINKAFYESPGGTYKFLDFEDMYVNKGEFVFVTTFAHNTRASGGRDSRVLISRLMKETKKFEYSLLDYTDDYGDIEVAMKYNNHNGMLYMMTSLAAAKNVEKYGLMRRSHMSGKYALEMSIIDPIALKVQQHYFIGHPNLDEYVKQHLKYKNPYYGVIQDFYINTDNTVSLLFEELDVFTYGREYSPTVGSGGLRQNVGMSPGLTTYATRLGEMGIVNIDQSGKEIGSYAIPKDQEARTKLDIWYQRQRSYYDWNFRPKKTDYRDNIAGFFSYDYFFTNNTGYVIYNDYVDNMENEGDDYKKAKKMRYISDANTIYATYDGKSVKKAYLFGEPADKHTSRFSLLEMNTHSDDGKSYATMMIEKNGRGKQAYIVWVTF